MASTSTSMSHIRHLQRTVDELHSLQKIQRVNTILYIAFAIGTIIMSSSLSSIIGKAGKYSSVSDDWQQCYISADTAYIPLNALVSKATSTTFAQPLACLQGALANPDCANNPCGTDVKHCVAGLTPSSTIKDVGLPTGHLLQSLSYLGIQAVIFAAISHGAAERVSCLNFVVS